MRTSDAAVSIVVQASRLQLAAGETPAPQYLCRETIRPRRTWQWHESLRSAHGLVVTHSGLTDFMLPASTNRRISSLRHGNCIPTDAIRQHEFFEVTTVLEDG